MNALSQHGPVVIIGAGPCGSLLAILLAGLGHDVEVFESRPDLRTSVVPAGRSINLALASRGIAALEEAGVMDEVAKRLIPMRGRMVHVDGSAVFQPYGSHDSDVIYSVSRGDLNAILLDAAEATGRVHISFEYRCRSVDLVHRVATFTTHASEVDEVSVGYGVVFGTDGASSALRDALVAHGDSVVSVEPLGHGYKELAIPAAAGLDPFQLDPFALHIWPRGQLMLIALANPNGDFTATLFMPLVGDSDSFESLNTPELIDDFFDRTFPGVNALVPDLAEQFVGRPTGTLSTIRTAGWNHGGDALLLGDAAHAIVPFHGQGMNAAMESCQVLSRHLASHQHDLAMAFRAFEHERKPDVDAIAEMALDNYIEMRAGVMDPSYLIKRQLGLELERRFPDRISPRYNMVMFSTMPYSVAQQRARDQGELLEELTMGIDSVAEVDFELAARLVSQLPPL